MSNEKSVVIQAREVKKTFGEFEAVRGVSFGVEAGECFGLLGPNGAGKSTLINMLYGSTRRTGGEMTVFGFDPHAQAREIKRRIGVVTQENALDESLTVRENMSLYAAFVSVPSAQRDARVTELLQYMNLAHKQNAPIRFLSGGMKRRLVFVRALLNQPQLVILDEPTTGLDPAVRHLLWGKINELKAHGKTVLLTTHYMHEAEVLCDRIVIMNHGQVISEGSPKDLRDRHVPGFVAVFEAGSDRREDIKSAALARGFVVSEDSSGVYVRAARFESLLQLQDEGRGPALQLRPSNLEDVFLKLTGQELNADA